ncbi:DUF6461 domain-containing protein [Streptacidiphilus sp. PAMC 29251]
MSGLDWMFGQDLPLLSLTFARDLTPGQLLERMGADPATLAERDRRAYDQEFGDLVYDDDGYVVLAGRYGSWAWAWEEASWRCVEDDRLVCAVSEQTSAVVLHTNEKPMVDFRYAENGRLVTGINTMLSLTPGDRTGSHIHRFDPELRALGADPDQGEAGPLGERELFFRLLEGLGIGLPHADLMTNPAYSARLRPPRTA